MVWRMGEMDAYQLLAELLRAEAGVASLPELAHKETGKPWFPDFPRLHFSLSHSGGLSLCALGEREVGCDIELVRPRKENFPAYVLGGRELRWFEDRGSRWEDFYALWTLKEARGKCTGEGLVLPVRDMAVPLLEPGESGELDGFVFTALGGETWRGALCEKLPMDHGTETGRAGSISNFGGARE